jgi:tetrahydromethanopterin S-methyltransferase subunit B
MTTAIDTDIQEIKTAIEANTKAIAALTLEIRVGFANIDTKFARLEGRIDNLETKLEGQINTVEAKLEGKIDQLDERTKLGFWGFIFRGTALAALAALTAIFVKYLFPILPTELPKL